MRLQLLGDPTTMANLRQVSRQIGGSLSHHAKMHFSFIKHQPELAAAAVSDPARFRELLQQFSAMQNSAKMQQQREAELLNSDPYNIEAQKKIEEAIRQEAVLENMESAMENMPESYVFSSLDLNTSFK